ncbi:hypothetical protein [Roseburia amylophila]|jgi:hypothetical protein|uniref:Uncharacterized protein n=1 Tax=Roseburia amylophila TaxID=2981794 RepID=A0ABT2SG70_9FIRM|nr:hypothetical protein [Roseburia amylophila]MCU6718016.1 hypothetical protein [Roseburia amylophila]SCI41655.1 Uncharacterised protein [uncultured Roseburia sp.]
MMRDFSPGAKELLMQYVDDVIASGVWETIENGKGEFNQAGQDWLSKLGISDYLDNMEGYYQNIISKHSTTKEEIEQIFSDVQQVDTRHIGTVAGLVTAGNAIITYFTDLADNINPNGGNLDIEKLRTTLEADRERLDQMQQSVVRNLIKDGKAEEAAEYIISVSRLNLTYDEFEALSEKEQLEYINRVAAWVLSIIPDVELEAGLYEVTVPLGVDMTASYCVSVKGTTDFGNQSTVNLVIKKQQMMLQSFKVSSENLFQNDQYSVNSSIGIAIDQDAKAVLSTTAEAGNNVFTLEYGSGIENTSVKYEIEEALNDNLKVASSIEIEKSNNIDMPEWEAVDIPVEEVTYSYESSYNESWMPDWEMVNEFMEGVTVVLKAVGEALICVVLVMMMFALI